MSSMFRSLGLYNYRLWFAGAIVSNIGTWMQRTAQDWIVLTDLTKHDAVAVGLTMALQFGPVLLLMPVSGLIADRVNRRKLLIITQVSMAALGLGLGLIVLLGVAQLWEVYAFALALGVAAAFDAPARQAFVSELVSGDRIGNAVALNSASFNVARLIGPAVAGLLVTAVGAGWVFMINAASFAGMLVALSLIRTVELQPAPRAGRERGQIREGWKYVLSRPDILVELIVVFLIGTFGFNFPIFLSTMASVEFGQGASAFGVLSSILAIGSVAGALLAARRDRPRIGVTVVAALGFGLMCLIASIAPNYWTFAACLVLVGFCAMSTTTSANSYVQTTTEPLMRGRVMALYMAIFAGGTPIGAPLVGWVANSMGPRWALGLAALSGVAASAVALGWLIRARNFRVHRGSGWRAPLAVSYDGKRQTPEDVAALLSTQEIATQRG